MINDISFIKILYDKSTNALWVIHIQIIPFLTSKILKSVLSQEKVN
jgi:hypothetical protein